MNVATISIDKKRAREEFLKYRAAARESGNADDALIASMYQEMAGGRRILNLHDSMERAGCGPDRLPKLAIGRANWEWVRAVRTYASPDVIRFEPEVFKGQRKTFFPSVPFGRLPGFSSDSRRRAMVPSIPPQLRPPDLAVRRYWILWEAVWQLAPPIDPILLKHLRGPFYAVLAQWDLTEVERAVLGLRASETTGGR